MVAFSEQEGNFCMSFFPLNKCRLPSTCILKSLKDTFNQIKKPYLLFYNLEYGAVVRAMDLDWAAAHDCWKQAWELRESLSLTLFRWLWVSEWVSKVYSPAHCAPPNLLPSCCQSLELCWEFDKVSLGWTSALALPYNPWIVVLDGSTIQGLSRHVKFWYHK